MSSQTAALAQVGASGSSPRSRRPVSALPSRVGRGSSAGGSSVSRGEAGRGGTSTQVPRGTGPAGTQLDVPGPAPGRYGPTRNAAAHGRREAGAVRPLRPTGGSGRPRGLGPPSPAADQASPSRPSSGTAPGCDGSPAGPSPSASAWWRRAPGPAPAASPGRAPPSPRRYLRGGPGPAALPWGRRRARAPLTARRRHRSRAAPRR